MTNPHISATHTIGLLLTVPMTNVFEAYSSQLSAGGWIEENRQIEANFATSHWTIQSAELGELAGSLLILQKTAESAEYTVYVSVEDPSP